MAVGGVRKLETGTAPRQALRLTRASLLLLILGELAAPGSENPDPACRAVRAPGVGTRHNWTLILWAGGESGQESLELKTLLRVMLLPITSALQMPGGGEGPGGSRAAERERRR